MIALNNYPTNHIHLEELQNRLKMLGKHTIVMKNAILPLIYSINGEQEMLGSLE